MIRLFLTLLGNAVTVASKREQMYDQRKCYTPAKEQLLGATVRPDRQIGGRILCMLCYEGNPLHCRKYGEQSPQALSSATNQCKPVNTTLIDATHPKSVDVDSGWEFPRPTPWLSFVI